jgi:hypothetical protein
MSLAVAAVGCGSSDDATPAKTAAASTATSVTTPPAVATTTTPAVTTTTTTPRRAVVTRSGNGHMYRCLGEHLLAGLHKTSGRIATGRKVLRRIKHELTRTKKKYPSNVAPPRVASRYNYLVRKYNAQVKVNRHRVRVYNHTLERECAHG